MLNFAFTVPLIRTADLFKLCLLLGSGPVQAITIGVRID